MSGAPTWVVGAGGLLGRHVVASLRRRAAPVLTADVPWQDPDAARAALADGVRRLEKEAAGGPWQVAWCAGTGVVGSTEQDMACERAAFTALTDHVADLPGMAGKGALFVASSAGGVYAGSPDAPPFTEDSGTAALVPYGFAKLAMEADVARFAAATGTRSWSAGSPTSTAPARTSARRRGWSPSSAGRTSPGSRSRSTSPWTRCATTSTPPTWATWSPRRCPRCASGWRACRCRSWSRWWPPAGA